VTIDVVYETHSTTEDNERGFATGWLPGRLSTVGREQAAAMGARRRDDGIDAVFTSDLGRALETVAIAFGGTGVPVLHDWRLRECDYGEWNGGPVDVVHGNRRAHLDDAYPGGETWREAVGRCGRAVADLPSRWDGRRVLVVGHVATFWGLEHAGRGIPLESLVDAPFVWREGWEYQLG
jgi:broad specificity phosphatase PhoE